MDAAPQIKYPVITSVGMGLDVPPAPSMLTNEAVVRTGGCEAINEGRMEDYEDPTWHACFGVNRCTRLVVKNMSLL